MLGQNVTKRHQMLMCAEIPGVSSGDCVRGRFDEAVIAILPEEEFHFSRKLTQSTLTKLLNLLMSGSTRFPYNFSHNSYRLREFSRASADSSIDHA